MKKFLFYWEELKSTFWFVPTLMIALSMVLAVVLMYLDSKISVPHSGILNYLLGESIESARSVLSTISGAMVSVAGTIFSITLVALTLTSNQFGSRLIKNFMYIRLNQVVLGAYVATYLYCLLILNSISGAEDQPFIPSLSILTALFLAIVNIILLIIFIHHIANSIQVNKVISDVSMAIAKNAQVLFPEKIGEGADPEKEWNETEEKNRFSYQFELLTPKMGYLQYLDNEALLNLILEWEALLDLTIKPGDYAVEGMRIGTLHVNADLEKEKIDKIFDHLIFGRARLSQQDIEFSINQLVEIAVRALSPGINDPFTAIMCIDNLTATVSSLAGVQFPSRFRTDEEDKLRIIAQAVTFEGVLNAAFGTIRQYSVDNIPVIIRLMEAMTIIQEFVVLPHQKQAIQRQAAMIRRQGKQCIKEEQELQQFERIAGKVMD